ncbi:MAG TPA: GntR family transcriptional regulator [Acidimicrobiales bacterium]
MYTARSASGLRSDLAYRDLKGRLLSGSFRLGERLAEERLAQLVGVSRTPVREALVRLQADGLVQRSDDGGFEPVLPDVVLMRQLYEVRVSLEVAGLQRPGRVGERHDEARLLALRDEWRALAGDPPEADPMFVLIDESFHIGLAEACGNRVLVHHLRLVNERLRVVRMHDFRTFERLSATIEEHLAIIDAVLAGDLVEAERRFGMHLEVSLAVVEERVARAQERMSSAPTPDPTVTTGREDRPSGPADHEEPPTVRSRQP